MIHLRSTELGKLVSAAAVVLTAAGLLTVSAPSAEAQLPGMASRVHGRVHEDRVLKLMSHRRHSPVRRNKAIGRELVERFGWSRPHWRCLNRLWAKESGWNQHSHNGGSGAHGIPQAMPGSKMASAGPDWATNPRTQIRWGLRYIRYRYGSPCAAWAHWGATHWY
ncbi:lytic transglycosylase domain-containing protein [Actinocorallia longicatena]|uniref:Transglycosylase-like protein with SLT domain n=1 Tax=Actinocorallia longicatena TaxID=111803 RepID=A0ABP6Q2V3_9ACTN